MQSLEPFERLAASIAAEYERLSADAALLTSGAPGEITEAWGK